MCVCVDEFPIISSLSLRYGTMQMRKKSGSRSDSFVFIYRRKSVGVDLNILAVRFFQKRKKNSSPGLTRFQGRAHNPFSFLLIHAA